MYLLIPIPYFAFPYPHLTPGNHYLVLCICESVQSEYKGGWLGRKKKNKNPAISSPQETPFRAKDTQIESEKMENDIQCKKKAV